MRLAGHDTGSEGNKRERGGAAPRGRFCVGFFFREVESRRKEREWVQFHNVVCRDMLRLQPLSHKLSSSLFKKCSFPSEALFLISRCIVTYQTRRGWTSQNPCFLCTYVLLSDSLYLAPLTSSGGERAGVRNRTLQEFLKYCSSMLIWREGARTYKQGKEEGIFNNPSRSSFRRPLQMSECVCMGKRKRPAPRLRSLPPSSRQEYFCPRPRRLIQ